MNIVFLLLAALFGILAAYIPMKLKLRKSEELVKTTDKNSWHDGFQTGWDHASADWTNVKKNYDRMLKGEVYFKH